MKLLTNEQQESYENVKTCYIYLYIYMFIKKNLKIDI